MSKTNRIKINVISVITILAIMFSLSLIITETHHDCSGDTCQICHHICFCKKIMQTFCILIIGIIVLIYIQKNILTHTINIRFSETLIILKVKLTN